MTEKKSGVRRVVTFRAHCGLCGWVGPTRSTQSMGSFDLAQHNIDRHGGSPRRGATD